MSTIAINPSPSIRASMRFQFPSSLGTYFIKSWWPKSTHCSDNLYLLGQRSCLCTNDVFPLFLLLCVLGPCSWSQLAALRWGHCFLTLQQPPYKDSLKSGLGILSFQKSLGYRLYNPSTLEAQVEQTLDMTTHL